MTGLGRVMLAIVLAATPAVAIAAPEAWAQAFVARWQAGTQAVGAATTAADARGPCIDLLAAAIDVDALTDQVAEAVAAGSSPARRDRLRAAVGRKLIADCAAHRGDERGATFTLLGVRAAGAQVFVTADASAAKRPVRRIVWRLRAPPALNPKAIDVSLQGRSLVADVREALERLVQSRGDLDRAIAALGGPG